MGVPSFRQHEDEGSRSTNVGPTEIENLGRKPLEKAQKPTVWTRSQRGTCIFGWRQSVTLVSDRRM